MQVKICAWIGLAGWLLWALPVAAQEAYEGDDVPAAPEPDSDVKPPMVTPLIMSATGEAQADALTGNTGAPGTWNLGDGCEEQSACVTQSLVRGGLCGAAESLEVTVTNKCTEPVAFGICVERVDGGWECALHKKLANGKSEKHAVSTCHATGRFNLRATKAADLAKNSTCLRSVAAAVRPPAAPKALPQPEPEMGPCTTAQACCAALAHVRGMESLGATCGQLGTLTDAANGPTCEQVMMALRQVLSAQMPNPPQACQ